MDISKNNNNGTKYNISSIIDVKLETLCYLISPNNPKLNRAAHVCDTSTIKNKTCGA
ncbi:uncharacterized protein ASCRUDRAFT_81805 [Ascoidea rubescens DSM 1968]|uniref:Uncharacterized protein n=1 Tax=Ascoidea rubescens DSM 1968 TaxID=1344418 RepID=A0A1D2VED1_9ASCO|nr:hypothetical protein ASCRUDRAFT_81805 [Ascoidea rubescens DSM 1968]ODV59942.1 hypothetical protein ASCRUDRAFT_81805 [Ascoidea rubescens DSM 1968]